MKQCNYSASIGGIRCVHSTLFRHPASHRNSVDLGQIRRDCYTGDPTAVCLGRYKVRNLLDSLYQGYPVGYLIAWRNPTIKLKDGTSAIGKRILIDGQQRVTALMAALLGREVLTKDYETVRIRIAFHPQEERFEVANSAIRKDSARIADVAEVFAPDASLTELTDDYSEKNPNSDRRRVSRVLERLRKIINNHVGFIELADDLDIETCLLYTSPSPRNRTTPPMPSSAWTKKSLNKSEQPVEMITS